MGRVLFSLLLTLPLFSSGNPIETSALEAPRMLVHLLSYIRADYGGAVVNGKVMSEVEYKEQREFLKHATELSLQLGPLKNNREFQTKFATLKTSIEQKLDSKIVGDLASALEKQAIELAKIEVTPQRWPDLHHGKMIYDRQCAQCHGTNGNGDGVAGKTLEPKPTNFHSEKMNGLPPFQAYNTIRLGVPGTGMANFGDLSARETWDLAFYVISIRHRSVQAIPPSPLPQGLSLKEISGSSDDDLLAKLPGSAEEKKTSLQAIRTHEERNESSFFFEARRLLNQALEQAQAGDWNLAKLSAVSSYLDGIEPIEPALRRRNPELISKMELKMGEVRRAIDLRSPELKSLVTDTQALIVTAEEISKKSDSSYWVSFWISFGIILREALEAILILVTILGVSRSFASRAAIMAIHGGWMAALAAGGVTWIIASRIISFSGADREYLEGIVALIAVTILIYLGFWLHQKTEIGRWRLFVEKMVSSAMEKKSLWAFALLSFTAVYRETFESVLFLQALSFEVGSSQGWAIASGAGSALLLMALITMIFSRLSLKLPIRQLCQVSSITMITLALVLLGKAVHSFQEVGLVPMTHFPLAFRFDLLGMFPTYETWAAQGLGLALILGIYLLKDRSWGNRPSVS